MKLSLVFVTWSIQIIAIKTVIAQSIGYHHNMNLGFNPYMSPVFGYGLGLPYGSYTHGPMKNPMLATSILAATMAHGQDFLSNLNTKSVLKKISPSNISQKLHKGTIMNKIALMKNPEYLFTPYGFNYGYGKHYGAAMIPNNPYKSAYGDNFYDMQPAASSTMKVNLDQNHGTDTGHHPVDPGLDWKMWKIKGFVKPLIKAGALIAAASLLKGKSMEIPSKLNPSGMILSGEHLASSKNIDIEG